MKEFKLLYLVGVLFIATTIYISSYKTTILKKEAIIDSLQQEILLRDKIIKQNK